MFAIKGSGLNQDKIEIGMQEQACAAIADIASKSPMMQNAILEGGALPKLINFMRSGSHVTATRLPSECRRSALGVPSITLG